MSNLSIELKLLKLFCNRENFNIEDYQDFDNAVSQFTYPIGLLLAVIEKCASTQYLTDFSHNYTYVSTIVNSLYAIYYTENERAIITIYIVQRLQPINETTTTTLDFIKQYINLTYTKTEIIELQKILTCYYTQTLILYHPECNEEIQQLIEQLETVEILPTLNQLTTRA